MEIFKTSYSICPSICVGGNNKGDNFSLTEIQHDYSVQHHDDGEDLSGNGIQIKVEEEAFTYASCDNEDDMLHELLVDEEEIVIDSDLTMKLFNDQCPMPIKTTSDDLRKRYLDWLSGSIPFNDSVCFIFVTFTHSVDWIIIIKLVINSSPMVVCTKLALDLSKYHALLSTNSKGGPSIQKDRALCMIIAS